MPTLGHRLRAVRAAWVAPEPPPSRPSGGGRRPPAPAARVPATPPPRRLRTGRPTSVELTLAAPVDLRPDPWQRLIAVGSILSVLVVAVGLWMTNEANRDQQRLSAQGQITERYATSVEQLGSEKLDVRLGAVYALERIARDSAQDEGPIIEVLCAFLRTHAPVQPALQGRAEESPPDVRAAVTVLGRRPRPTWPEHRVLDLTNVYVSIPSAALPRSWFAGTELALWDLTDTDLTGSTFTGALLHRAHLDSARLVDADLSDAVLTEATATHANLAGANLSGADLRDANLSRADLSGADLRDADLRDADLTGANLRGADLTGAKLRGADLTGADLSRAKLSDPYVLEHVTRPSP
ncbi:pentapeptide repeat-containing protein [Micromonospora sp. NBC_01412]|uniref:pentapeptide repeat-containing protein n=1 Tax=Micromonospora sp. NBC_01412 TaxID=2903590 RepID=UPI0032457685